jgi:TatD DNase family protein
VHEVATQLPLAHLLIETDAPYLAPVPYRGKTNEPAHVIYVAKKIVDLKNAGGETVSVAQVAAASTNNFFNLFRKIER